MTNTDFVIREYCPVCGEQGNVILNAPYNHPRLAQWLAQKYENRIPESVLNTGRYIIRYCKHCNMNYMKDGLVQPTVSSLKKLTMIPGLFDICIRSV